MVSPVKHADRPISLHFTFAQAWRTSSFLFPFSSHFPSLPLSSFIFNYLFYVKLLKVLFVTWTLPPRHLTHTETPTYTEVGRKSGPWMEARVGHLFTTFSQHRARFWLSVYVLRWTISCLVKQGVGRDKRRKEKKKNFNPLKINPLKRVLSCGVDIEVWRLGSPRTQASSQSVLDTRMLAQIRLRWEEGAGWSRTGAIRTVFQFCFLS